MLPFMKFCFAAGCLSAVIFTGVLPARTFTDNSGRSIEAEMVAFDGVDVVTIRRSDGQEFNLQIDRLSTEDQDFVRAWKPAEQRSVDPAEIKSINQIIGADLFADANLWDDTPSEVARRLDWPLESLTDSQSSFRKYNSQEDQLFGARPYSSALYGRDGKVDMISIVFANKGDAGRDNFSASPKELLDVLDEAIEMDGDKITKRLSSLGEPEQRTTATGRGMKERLQIWYWQDHAFALAVQDEEYVALRIMPKALVESRGRPEHSGSVAVREAAKANVDKRDNSDVVITNIPMVDQGPKGYCAPATLERVMRYMGVRADMYLLAMAGQTGVGGGTSVKELLDGTEKYLGDAGRKMEPARMRLKVRNVAKYIDEGQPILWAMYSTPEYNAVANSLSEARTKYTNIGEWKEALEKNLDGIAELKQNIETSHICLIVGYNEETDEIAVSDSWGPQYQMRWVPADLAAQISQDGYWVISF